MGFFSLLFTNEETKNAWEELPRNVWDNTNKDMNLDFIMDAIAQGDVEYPSSYLRYPCSHQEITQYRLDIMQEIYQNRELKADLEGFCSSLGELRKFAVNVLDTKGTEQKQLRFSDLASCYIRCVEELYQALDYNPKSAGLKLLFKFISEIKASDGFISLKADTQRIRSIFGELLAIPLYISFGQMKIQICSEEAGEDLSREIVHAAKELFGINLRSEFSIVHNSPVSALEEALINKLKLLYPEAFNQLGQYYETHHWLRPYTLIDLRSELLFYLLYIDFVNSLEKRGFDFCIPKLTKGEGFMAFGCYDLGLAVKLSKDGKSAQDMVSNDIQLQKGEFFILTGPNQGGKTTYLRTVGLIAMLAKNGCLVPCKSCSLPGFDNVFTHFHRSEIVGLGKGRLGEEVDRLKEMLPMITQNSLILLNESFASTRRNDGVELSISLIDRLLSIGATGGMATHYYELAGEYQSRKIYRVKSYVAEVETEGESGRRTYRIVPCPPDGLAYARDIALSCGVTFEQLDALLGGDVGA